jgi:hypothetical protein
MITQYEVPGYLARLLPAATTVPQFGPINVSIYKDIQRFTDFTRQAVNRNNYTVAKRCFHLADTFYRQGDAIVRNAVENIFVYSFSSFIPQNGVEKLILKSFIPASLYALYSRQIGQGGC